MGPLFFSTGKAGSELGVSQERMRDLCAAGAIEAEVTAGRQWRISRAVVERLKRDGLPPLPRPMPGDSPRSGGTARCGSGALLAPPSEQVIEAAEEVVVLENEVKALGLRRQREEALDWFRERESDEADQRAAEERDEQARLAEEQAQRNRDDLLRSWEAHAMDSVPRDAPSELRLRVQEVVRERLLALDPMPAPAVTEQIVEALVVRLLAPWRQEKKILAVLVEARDTMLPAAARGYGNTLSQWQIQAIRAAGEAIKQLRDDAPIEEIRAVAREAVAAVIQEFDHDQHSKRLVEDLWLQLRDATSAELETARNEVGKALAGLPPTASERDREATRDAAIAPLRKAIARRQAEAEAERQRIQAEERAEQQRRQAEAQAAENRKWAAVLASQERAEHNRDKRAMLIGLFTTLPLDTVGALTVEARAAVSEALDALPAGSSWDEMARARDKALAPYLAEHEQRQRKGSVIAGALREVYPCLVKLERSWDYKGATAWDLAQQFQKPVRAALEKRLTGDEPPDQLSKLVRQLCLRELSATPEPAGAR